MLRDRIATGERLEPQKVRNGTSATERHGPPAGRASVRSRTRVTAIDLFSGAGGFSLGALLAGIDVIAAVDNDKHACSTYRRNLVDSGRTGTKVFETDLRNISPLELMEECRLQQGDCDVLLGGPPCQGFSSHRLNDSGVDDPRNSLLLHYFEYVRAVRPKVFIVENVPGMLWPRHRTYLDSFYKLAEKCQYQLARPLVLNARDYGVPQNRRRAFLFGIDRLCHASYIWPPPVTHGPPKALEPSADNGLKPWRTAAEAFSLPAPQGDPNDIHMRHNADLTTAFARTPPNGGSRIQSGRVLKCHDGHAGHYDVYGRIDPRTPGPTMTTACINPSKGRFVHPTEPHGITLRQAARLQTFPDWFVFDGGLMSGGVQIGNAIPVELARAILAPLAWQILKGGRSERESLAPPA